MSRTDKDRPWAMKADDPAVFGYIAHRHGVEGPCDYTATNNTTDHKRRYDPNYVECRCYRVAWSPQDDKPIKRDRKRFMRSERYNVRRQLRNAQFD